MSSPTASNSSNLSVKVNFIERMRGLFSLLFTCTVLKFLPLSAICKIIGATKHRQYNKLSVEEARIIWKSINQSSLLFIGRVACMELSLAFIFHAIIKGKGQNLVWCLGTKTKPFCAHAWIEIDNVPFPEPDYAHQDFQAMITI